MKRWQVRYMQGACITFMTAGMISLAGVATSMAATSSCIQCHTDEDMLEENLSKVKAKGSTLTSGAG